MKNILRIGLSGLALLGLSVPAARLALAAPATVTFTVNNTLDAIDDNPGDGACHTAPASPAQGGCTLRAAVGEANQASGAGATIILPAGTYALSIPAAGLDGPGDGDLNLTQPPMNANPVITLAGAGAASTIIDANQIDRVLAVTNGRTAVISGVTLRGGFLSGDTRAGSGVDNEGTLTLDHSTVSGNQVSDNIGGGLANGGTMTVTDSTIGPDNMANTGAGLHNEGSLVLARSTVYGNSGVYAGGIFNDFTGNLVVINSTLSDNNVVDSGGGIYNRGSANVYNTTIAFNGADSGRNSAGTTGGVFNQSGGTFNLRNTLLAGNYVGNAPVPDNCAGTLNTYGWDVIAVVGDPAPACTINVVNGGSTPLNFLNRLGHLQANGGPTLTDALLPGNSAIDNGQGCIDNNSVPLATDQRGASRIVDTICDVGAFEYSPLSYTYLPAVRR